MIERSNNFIGGEWVPGSAGTTIDVLSPATESVVGRISGTTAADADLAIAAARRAFDTGPWSRYSAHERAECLRELRRQLLPLIDEIASTITAETGTPISLSRAMNRNAIERFSMYAGFVDHLTKTDVRAGAGANVAVTREPVGVAALITPWNGPFASAITKIAPALLAGCTVVLKPPTATPLASFMLADAAERAGIPAGVINIVPGEKDVGVRLVESPDVDQISLTGSLATGRAVLASAASDLKRVTLELGGKSAGIVLPDAPMDLILSCTKTAGFYNSGLACVAWSRILIQREQYDEVVAEMARNLGTIVPKDPSDATSSFGPITTPQQLALVEKYVQGALAEGATVATGGARVEGFQKGWWYQPTLLRDITNDMVIAQEEVFGPVQVAIPYDDVDDAIAIANDSKLGLSGGVISADVDRAREVAARLRTGTVGINSFALADIAPFGGRKQSGLGREWGPEGLDAFLEYKSVSSPV